MPGEKGDNGEQGALKFAHSLAIIQPPFVHTGPTGLPGEKGNVGDTGEKGDIGDQGRYGAWSL